MTRVAAALAVLALAVLAMQASARSADPWGLLYRPLRVPQLAPGEPCPVSGVPRFAFRKFGVANGIGAGPAYPIGLGQPGSVLHFRYPPPEGSVMGPIWSGAKVVWFVAPAYRGRVLVRGQRLDGPEILRFGDGVEPSTEVRIPVGARGGWPRGVKRVGQRYRPSSTRLRAPGCYAYQVDGASFSRIVVFRALATTGP